MIAFGGLYKVWVDRITGEQTHSASIITLPGHPALTNIHRKSTPLWLAEQEIGLWLDRGITDTGVFAALLTPKLVTGLTATPIEKVSTQKVIGQPFTIYDTSKPSLTA